MRLGRNDHTLFNLGSACSEKIRIPVYLDHTDTAGTDLIYLLEITKRRDTDIIRSTSFKYRAVLFYS